MNTNTISFQDFIEKNKDKIRVITPKMTYINEDPEWEKETEWDELYRDIKEN